MVPCGNSGIGEQLEAYFLHQCYLPYDISNAVFLSIDYGVQAHEAEV